MLRHEQQSIRMALATVMHHSFKVHTEHGAPRSQTTATKAREGEVREQHSGLRAQERPLLGTRPAPLLEVLPQVGAQRHTVDQIVDAVPGLPTLDGPVPQKVEQLADFFNGLDSQVLVQVIDVPKIFIERIPPRTSVREPQLAEQLVEVPTIVSFSLLQWIMEQTVDIPVPQAGGRHADLQGFLRGQSSTGVEQIVDIPGGGLHRPGQSSSSADEPGEGFFRTFPQNLKKCEVCFALGDGTASRVEPTHAGCSAGGLRRVGAAQGTPRWQDLLLEQDVLTVQSGRLQLVPRSCGTAKGMRRELSGTGTGIRASVRLTSLLFLVGEGRHRRGRLTFL